MLSQCPHCQENLNFNEGQKQKLQTALNGLKSGTLKLGCPYCKQHIHLRANGSVVDMKAATVALVEKENFVRIKPPDYPDISWMANEICDENEVMEDVAKALVLMPEGEARDNVARAFVDLGYQITFPESAGDAVEQMRFVNFTVVVFYTDFDGNFAESEFHAYMSQMPMSSRREIYYVLIGSELRTLYDLEALAFSANIVVNDAEVKYFDTILGKGLRDYDELFGPYIAALAVN